MAKLECQILSEDAVHETAKVMAKAFATSPAYAFLFQGAPPYRRKALEWFFERNLKFARSRCPSALRGVLNEDGEVVACFLWLPSAHLKLSTWDILFGAGLWQIPFRFGLSTLKRIAWIADHLDQSEINLYGPAKERRIFVKLERMAVRPDFQGQGLGTTCLETVLCQK